MNLNADSTDDESFSNSRTNLNADSSDDEICEESVSRSKSSSASPEPEPSKKKTGRVLDSSDDEDERNSKDKVEPRIFSEDSDEQSIASGSSKYELFNKCFI